MIRIISDRGCRFCQASWLCQSCFVVKPPRDSVSVSAHWHELTVAQHPELSGWFTCRCRCLPSHVPEQIEVVGSWLVLFCIPRPWNTDSSRASDSCCLPPSSHLCTGLNWVTGQLCIRSWKQSTWVSISLCEVIYNNFFRNQGSFEGTQELYILTGGTGV